MTTHPLDPFGPKPGTPEYKNNFDKYYDENYLPFGGDKVTAWLFIAVIVFAMITAVWTGFLNTKNKTNSHVGQKIQAR